MARKKRDRESYRLIITVKQIRGYATFKVGDRIVVEEPRILTAKTDTLCMHALGAMLTFLAPLSSGITHAELGPGKGKVGYIHCPDPSSPHTKGGTVLFEIRRQPM